MMKTLVIRQKVHSIELRENQIYHYNVSVLNIIELYTIKW